MKFAEWENLELPKSGTQISYAFSLFLNFSHVWGSDFLIQDLLARVLSWPLAAAALRWVGGVKSIGQHPLVRPPPAVFRATSPSCRPTGRLCPGCATTSVTGSERGWEEGGRYEAVAGQVESHAHHLILTHTHLCTSIFAKTFTDILHYPGPNPDPWPLTPNPNPKSNPDP